MPGSGIIIYKAGFSFLHYFPIFGRREYLKAGFYFHIFLRIFSPKYPLKPNQNCLKPQK